MEELSRAEKVTITGYTDDAGEADDNAALSLQRAEAVRDYLVTLGADPQKLQASGAGEAKPVADNRAADGRRRTAASRSEVIA